jgi:YD repeat-containing protein
LRKTVTAECYAASGRPLPPGRAKPLRIEEQRHVTTSLERDGAGRVVGHTVEARDELVRDEPTDLRRERQERARNAQERGTRNAYAPTETETKLMLRNIRKQDAYRQELNDYLKRRELTLHHECPCYATDNDRVFYLKHQSAQLVQEARQALLQAGVQVRQAEKSGGYWIAGGQLSPTQNAETLLACGVRVCPPSVKAWREREPKPQGYNADLTPSPADAPVTRRRTLKSNPEAHLSPLADGLRQELEQAAQDNRAFLLDLAEKECALREIRDDQAKFERMASTRSEHEAAEMSELAYEQWELAQQLDAELKPLRERRAQIERELRELTQETVTKPKRQAKWA